MKVIHIDQQSLDYRLFDSSHVDCDESDVVQIHHLMHWIVFEQWLLNWSSMQIEAQLAQDRNGRAGVFGYSPLKIAI